MSRPGATRNWVHFARKRPNASDVAPSAAVGFGVGVNGTERQGDRQRSQRCAGGSPHKNLNDVVAENHQRCTVGSHLLFSTTRHTAKNSGLLPRNLRVSRRLLTDLHQIITRLDVVLVWLGVAPCRL